MAEVTLCLVFFMVFMVVFLDVMMVFLGFKMFFLGFDGTFPELYGGFHDFDVVLLGVKCVFFHSTCCSLIKGERR